VEVLGLLAQGLTNPEIARRLAVSAFTVKRHVANILTKLDLPTAGGGGGARGARGVGLAVEARAWRKAWYSCGARPT
jgi:DNA-binding NarL/FixJ family response regulator